MKKVVYIIAITLTVLTSMLLTSCTQNSALPIKQIIEDSKPYDDDSKELTKYDIAVWLMKIVRSTEDSKYKLNSESNQELFREAVNRQFVQGSDDSSMDDDVS